MHPRAIDRVLREWPFEDGGEAARPFVHLAGATLAIRAKAAWEPSARARSAPKHRADETVHVGPTASMIPYRRKLMHAAGAPALNQLKQPDSGDLISSAGRERVKTRAECGIGLALARQRAQHSGH